MSHKPTLKELSAKTGLSIATISRALSNSHLVKDETRKLVEDALKELQIKGNKEYFNIGLVIPDLRNQFFPLMHEGINSVADTTDATILICSSQNCAQKEEKIIRRLIDSGVDGIILISQGETYPYLERLVDNKSFPIVFLDRDPGLKNINLIVVDNLEGMYQASKYLITLGHRNILFLGGTKGTSTSQERYTGFLNAFRDSDLDRSGITVEHADYSKKMAYEIVRRKLEQNDKTPFTAICASNDEMALGAINALSEYNLRIPQDVTVIGFDDTPSAIQSGLTTVRQPLFEIGKNAMYLIISAIRDPSAETKRITMPCSLVLRNTAEHL